MPQLLDSLYAAGHKPFDLQIERLVALLRVVMTAFCMTAFAAVTANVPNPPKFDLILWGYILFGVAVALLPTVGKFRTGWQLPVHLVDIAVISILMYFIQSLSTTFFVLYVFVLLSATMRWDWRGALFTTAILLALHLILYFTGPVAAQFLLQSVFLLIIGGMFAFFGASRERSALRLAQIAAWPSVSAPVYADIDNHWLNASLKHVADVMQVRRVLVLWEFAQEPYMFTALLEDGSYRQHRATSTFFNDAVAPELANAAFASVAIKKGCFTTDGAAFLKGPAIGPSMQTQYNISSVCSAPFAGDFCKGRVFMLERSDWGDDDLALAEVVASRLRIELENYALFLRLNEAAASQERVRLARDLHDGTLQSLAAAGLQLKMIASHSEEKVHRTVENVRNLVLGEQKRIREFITGKPVTHPQEPINLHEQILGEVSALMQRWGCDISLSVIPADAMVLPETSRQIVFIVAEATANAVRHGNSSRISIEVEQTAASIRLQVADNGTGLEGASDQLNETDLAANGLGPQSISKRVNDLRGTLSLSSSREGVRLAIELPYAALPPRKIHGDANAYG